MVRDRRLADVAAAREVAGADLAVLGQLPDDGQAGRVGKGLEQLDLGVDGALHADILSTNFDIDKYQSTH